MLREINLLLKICLLIQTLHLCADSLLECGLCSVFNHVEAMYGPFSSVQRFCTLEERCCCYTGPGAR